MEFDSQKHNLNILEQLKTNVMHLIKKINTLLKKK